MAIQSDDILTKTFTRKLFGGYSTSEVINFLKTLADEVEKHGQKQQTLTEKLKEKEIYIQEFRNREDLLKNTVISAQKMADQIKQSAQKQARFILEDAQQKADLLVQDARDSLKTAYQDLSDLRKMHIQLKNALKAVLQSHQDLLEQDPIHSILPSVVTNPKQTTELKEQTSMIEKKMAESLNQAAQTKEYL